MNINKVRKQLEVVEQSASQVDLLAVITNSLHSSEASDVIVRGLYRITLNKAGSTIVSDAFSRILGTEQRRLAEAKVELSRIVGEPKDECRMIKELELMLDQAQTNRRNKLNGTSEDEWEGYIEGIRQAIRRLVMVESS